MNFPLLILDGVLLLIFLVGWAEATCCSTYCLTSWRLVRAVSLPVGAIAFLHLMTALNWWLPLFSPLGILFRPGNHWLTQTVITGALYLCGMAFMVFLPIAVVGLTSFVTSQFAPKPMLSEEEVEPQ